VDQAYHFRAARFRRSGAATEQLLGFGAQQRAGFGAIAPRERHQIMMRDRFDLRAGGFASTAADERDWNCCECDGASKHGS
jgi:hypothetical protein